MSGAGSGASGKGVVGGSLGGVTAPILLRIGDLEFFLFITAFLPPIKLSSTLLLLQNFRCMV